MLHRSISSQPVQTTANTLDTTETCRGYLDYATYALLSRPGLVVFLGVPGHTRSLTDYYWRHRLACHVCMATYT